VVKESDTAFYRVAVQELGREPAALSDFWPKNLLIIDGGWTAFWRVSDNEQPLHLLCEQAQEAARMGREAFGTGLLAWRSLLCNRSIRF